MNLRKLSIEIVKFEKIMEKAIEKKTRKCW